MKRDMGLNPLPRYRIVTNGRAYRVQRRFLWFWISEVYGYHSCEDAARRVEERMQEEGLWRPIGPGRDGYQPVVSDVAAMPSRPPRGGTAVVSPKRDTGWPCKG